MKSLRGTGVALITPFTQDLAIDFDSLKKLLHFTVQGGVDYLVVNGTTAESPTTTDAEKEQILAFVKDFTQGKLPLVYGVGSNDTRSLVETIKKTDFSGIQAILSVSPYYNKPSQQGLYQHYIQLADACPVPVILYNVPGRTASNVTAETTLKLAKHPNIIGIKEASGNLEQCLQLAKHKSADFMLISGDDLLTVPMISFGAEGVISVLANAFPEKFSKMVKLALDNNFPEATKLLFDFVDINPLMYEESNPVGVKAILEMLGIAQPHVRLPLVDATMALKSKLQKLL
ncbi:4-hydroxy-tetrahydrodipicolinate synthase [Adhaeribacter radiodurans]|uniref:4-hydroxy-tetrahydrodipicolinate synthase n=1 Tax=Adhaeribacter radiodurans TaxID=2745197 RepID=A0A7L7L9D7_9BACT|nr:4-hydroxy-tetrahydrodipicolinate synthase [Adhaeribacter radiodurans]QMU29456.1 4-hydroxy-tetrahydrodipicolinate synthase [Adhaeribacter radiodurans]